MLLVHDFSDDNLILDNQLRGSYLSCSHHFLVACSSFSSGGGESLPIHVSKTFVVFPQTLYRYSCCLVIMNEASLSFLGQIISQIP